MVHHLAKVQQGIADVPAPDQLVPAVHVDVVLVAVTAFAVLFRPARIRVLLAALGGLVRPVVNRLAGRDGLVFIALGWFFSAATMEASRVCPSRVS